MKIEFTENQLGTVMCALQCAMLEAGRQNNENMWEKFNEAFEVCIHANENYS